MLHMCLLLLLLCIIIKSRDTHMLDSLTVVLMYCCFMILTIVTLAQ